MSVATAYRQKNPFTPVFGKMPAYMAGREQIIDDMVDAFESGNSDPNLCSIFTGARGTGKTALLTYLSYMAEQCGWISANVTASPNMLDDILQRLEESAAHLAETGKGKRVNSVEIASLGSISWEYPEEKLNWRSKMNRLFAQLQQTGTGILITVDEVDASLPQMTELVTTYQHFVRENKKASLLMAGLPFNISALLSGKSTPFLRHAAQHDLGSIPDFEVKEAFRLTVEDGGKQIKSEVLDRAAEVTDGFPFMFQLVGYRAWNLSRQAGEISLENLEDGIRLAREELEARVFGATLSELSPGDLEFLSAMNTTGITTRAEVLERSGKSSRFVSSYKKRLAAAGVIDEPLPGRFRFALPGFAEYLEKVQG